MAAPGSGSSSRQPYIDRVRAALQGALCLQAFPSQKVERQSRPEVEFPEDNPELLLEPVLVCRSESERCLIEGAINSARVSLAVKQADAVEEIIARMLLRFLMQRAEQFGILRRIPVQGYPPPPGTRTPLRLPLAPLNSELHNRLNYMIHWVVEFPVNGSWHC